MARPVGLRAQEVAALQRALESERVTSRAAVERSKELQQALDSERSAGRALRREAVQQLKTLKEEEARKHAALVEQLRIRMELSQAEVLATEKEQLSRTLTAQFQRELKARQEEWSKESRRQLEPLQEQLKEAHRVSLEAPAKSEIDTLVHSMHAEFHHTLLQKQEEWKKETKSQVDAVTSQLRELQRLYTETCNKLTNITNEAETIPKLRQENQTLKLHSKELEEKIQMLMEADRRKMEEFRAQHEENVAKVSDFQRAARKETFQLLEEMKGKDRIISQLQREYHLLAGRLSVTPSPRGRSRNVSETSTSVGHHQDRPGEPPRLCIKRPKTLTFASDVNKRLRAQEGHKPPDPPGPDTNNTIRDDEQKSNETLKETTEESKESSNEKENTFQSEAVNNWTKTVGVETLYQLLLEEHQELQKTHVNTLTRLREEEKCRAQLEEKLQECRRVEGDNVINLALAEQIQQLQERQEELEAEAQELREQNDLLEFRILELDEGVCAQSCSSFHFKSPSSRSPDTRDRELDDISDSGVMSLPTSEDISEADFQDFKMEPNNRDVKSKLAQLCQSLENVAERISVQQALALLRHYETRLENLEATLAAMCQEATQAKSSDQQLPPGTLEHIKSPSRIIATVLPFTDMSSNCPGKDLRDEIPLKRLLRDQDCMQESGIFEDGGLTSCFFNIGTQTDWTFEPPPGDLGAEIRKLTQIRERIEEKGGNKKLLNSPDVESKFLNQASLKDLLFYRDRTQTLEDKVAIYESRGDEQSKLLAKRLEKEVILAAQVKNLQRSVRHLKEENVLLEEEKCEFEEAENDTRLRCQKLEVKLSALGEKKSDLQVQLQQHVRTLSNLRSSLSEEERKRNEARQYAAKMEAFANRLEQQNFEMEEKEVEIRYRLHTLEGVVPAMVMFYLWKLLNSVRPLINKTNSNTRLVPIHGSKSDSILSIPNLIEKQVKPKKLKNTKPHSRSLDGPECLRYSLNDLEEYLKTRQAGEIPESADFAVDVAFLNIEKLSQKCKMLEEKTNELEIKEKAYQEALQSGDELLLKIEVDYKHQLKCLEDELTQKHFELEQVKSQFRKQPDNQELELQFQEQLSQLENDVLQLQAALAKKDKDNKVLEEEVTRLTTELEESFENLEKFKENVEKPLREEVDYQKKRVRELLGDLDQFEQEKEENDEMHKKLVKELKKINNHACRQLEESEVTISELKEEVQTLESEVAVLREALSSEQDNRERLLIRVGAELEAKDRQIQSFGNESPVGSLHEELLSVDAAERQVDAESMMDVAASTVPPTTSQKTDKCDCLRADQAVKDFDPNNLTSKLLDQVSSAYQHSRSCRHCRNSTAVELRGILNLLQKIAPQSKMAQINHLLLLR